MATAHAPLTIPDAVGKKHEHDLEEYLVKETFVPTHSQGNRKTRKMVVRRRKQKVDASLLSIFCAWVVEHQLGMPNRHLL